MPTSYSPTSAENEPAAQQAPLRPGNLHGRRCGRPLRARQRTRLDQALPALEIDLAGWAGIGALFQHPIQALRLEIGFGSGEHLAAEAERQPEVGFIGCEPFRNGIAKMVEEVETRELRNVRLFLDDAALLLDRLPDASIDGVDLLYPDPWPKRRQRKRRFVSEAVLDQLARVLVPGGEFRFATDIDDYAAWTLARVFHNRYFLWSAQDAWAWRMPWQPWSSTRYEAKALREGRKPVYLTFRRR